MSVYDIFSLLGAGGAVVLPDASRERDPGPCPRLDPRPSMFSMSRSPRPPLAGSG
jgi:hypothetical protein